MNRIRKRLSILAVALALTGFILAVNVAPASADFTVSGGPGYNITVGSQIKVVFSRAVTKWIFYAGVAQDCKACLVWNAVDLANKQMPQTKTVCAPPFNWPCWTMTIRSHFIEDVKGRTNDLFTSIVNAYYIYGDCLYWQVTGTPRDFSSTHTGCKN
jgi:hypothetical protein